MRRAGVLAFTASPPCIFRLSFGCIFPLHHPTPSPILRPPPQTQQTKPTTLRFARAPEPHVAIKEFGLTALSTLLRVLNGPRRLSDAATLRLLTRLQSLLATIPPGSLFPDWSPPAMAPEAPLVLKASDIAADSERAPSHGGGWTDPRGLGRACVHCGCNVLLVAGFNPQIPTLLGDVRGVFGSHRWAATRHVECLSLNM
jgi:hypothetical protein